MLIERRFIDEYRQIIDSFLADFRIYLLESFQCIGGTIRSFVLRFSLQNVSWIALLFFYITLLDSGILVVSNTIF